MNILHISRKLQSKECHRQQFNQMIGKFKKKNNKTTIKERVLQYGKKH